MPSHIRTNTPSHLEIEGIEKPAVQEMSKLGAEAYKLALIGMKGFPDRTVFLGDGKIIFMEFKQPGKPLSRLQVKWKQTLEHFGFKVFRVDSVEQAVSIVKEEKGV